MAGRFALDIETVSPPFDHYEKPPDFQDPEYFELLAVALGYEAVDGAVETEVFFRRSNDAAGELRLVEQVLEWVTERSGDTYLTYGGAFFDVPQLIGRSRIAAEEHPTREHVRREIEQLLEDRLNHVDLKEPSWDAFGQYTRLEDACKAVGIEPEDTHWNNYEHGIDLDDVRPQKYQGFEKVINKDVTVFGERYLALADVNATGTVTFRALHELLDHYGREDIAHLFELADARPFA